MYMNTDMYIYTYIYMYIYMCVLLVSGWVWCGDVRIVFLSSCRPVVNLAVTPLSIVAVVLLVSSCCRRFVVWWSLSEECSCFGGVSESTYAFFHGISACRTPNTHHRHHMHSHTQHNTTQHHTQHHTETQPERDRERRQRERETEKEGRERDREDER